MPLLNTLPAETSPVHLLLISPTKMGKSTYSAEAALDGFNLIYIDADNGRSAIEARLDAAGDAGVARKRINYFRPKYAVSFVTAFLKSSTKKPLLWLPNQHRSWRPMGDKAEDDEPVWVIDSQSIPSTSVLVIDSWTSLASDALGVARPDQASALLDAEADQSLYGEARMKLVYISNLLQGIQCHVIVQAHTTRYEIYDKPKGGGGGQAIKQKDLTLVETIDVPVSSSRAHGLEMASRFNHIARLDVNSLGVTEIDFTRKSGRVNGGPPNKKAKTTELSFAALVKASGSGPGEDSLEWYHETTLGELRAMKDGIKK
jgi:hypothetical protein